MSGQVVRLQQGLAAECTVFPGLPAAWAMRWVAEGGDWMHVVDLDAAFSGEPENMDAVRAIVEQAGVPVQLGGGMRSLSTLRAAFELGVARAIIGTRAAESLAFVRDAVVEFGGERIAVGIDAKNGFVAVKGWTESSPRRGVDLARQVSLLGVGTIIYTDVATDGMMGGPNYAALDEIVNAVEVPVIASGGVSSNANLTELASRPKLYGAITGRALYEGAVDMRAWKAGSETATPED